MLTVDVAAGAAVDFFDNYNTASMQFVITYDSIAPNVVIASTATSSTRVSPISISIEFSEEVAGFEVGGVVVTNGAVGSFVAVDGDSYTAEVIPTVDGVVTVDVDAAVAQDAASNDNAAAVQFGITYDSLAPTVVISSSASNPTPTAPIPVVFEFSEDVNGFTVGDIAVSNGVIGNFASANGNSYTAKISPSADGVVLKFMIAAEVAQDAAGNLSSAAAMFLRNYQSSDSDGDGVSDATEINDGTNQLDSGSYFTALPTSWCSDWNGFFGIASMSM